MICVQERGLHLFVVNGMNRIQESMMENTVAHVEPDIIAQDSEEEEEHEGAYNTVLSQI